jgi:hypothetical protein
VSSEMSIQVVLVWEPLVTNRPLTSVWSDSFVVVDVISQLTWLTKRFTAFRNVALVVTCQRRLHKNSKVSNITHKCMIIHCCCSSGRHTVNLAQTYTALLWHTVK